MTCISCLIDEGNIEFNDADIVFDIANNSVTVARYTIIIVDIMLMAIIISKLAIYIL